MKVLLAPDSFKGCLSSVEVCAAMAEGINDVNPDIEIMQFPSSDGGEGFCDCMRNIFGGVTVKREVTYPMGGKGEAEFVYNRDDRIAFIELASAAGLGLVPENKRNILGTTTFGVGELIAYAIELGAEKVVVGLGGSATNDCGIGLLSALGIRFLDEQGNELEPIAGSLDKVHSVDRSDMMDFGNTKFVAACDVKNPLCGENGAAEVFARQKGAKECEICWLDDAAYSFTTVLGADPNGVGYGAAGGVGMALISELGAEYVSGASLLVSSERFCNAIKTADLLITGEGNTDAQTAYGKLVSVVVSSAKDSGVPSVVISGGLSKGYEALFSVGAKECYALREDGMELEYCIKNAYKLITKKTKTVIERYV